MLTKKPFYKFYKIVFIEINDDDIYYIDDTSINLVAAQKIKKHTTILYSSTSSVASKGINYYIDNIKELKIICKTKR